MHCCLYDMVCQDYLDLVERVDIHGLDVVLEAGDVLLKDVSTDLVVLNHTGDTELLNTVTDGNKLRGTPEAAIEFNTTDELLELSHISGIIPRLDVKDDAGLGNDGGLLGLLSLVLGKTGSLGLLSLLIFLLVRSEKVDIIIVLLGRSSRGSRSVLGSSLLGARETTSKDA